MSFCNPFGWIDKDRAFSYVQVDHNTMVCGKLITGTMSVGGGRVMGDLLVSGNLSVDLIDSDIYVFPEGIYTPLVVGTSPLALNGELVVNGPLVVTGPLYVGQNLVAKESVSVGEIATMDGNLQVKGTVRSNDSLMGNSALLQSGMFDISLRGGSLGKTGKNTWVRLSGTVRRDDFPGSVAFGTFTAPREGIYLFTAAANMDVPPNKPAIPFGFAREHTTIIGLLASATIEILTGTTNRSYPGTSIGDASNFAGSIPKGGPADDPLTRQMSITTTAIVPLQAGETAIARVKVGEPGTTDLNDVNINDSFFISVAQTYFLGIYMGT